MDFVKQIASLSLRERGLKYLLLQTLALIRESLSLRERGLKSASCRNIAVACKSLSLRERGLKYYQFAKFHEHFFVALLARAWIEIAFPFRAYWRVYVALLARAWIEIRATDTGRRKKTCRSPCESVD